MSLSGARGLVRIATNLECELQAAMVANRYSETELYRAITGQYYPREYGERVSARRRGAKFEANLYQNDAALLRRATGALYGHDPSRMWVRNFLDELPGNKDDRRALRASRFRQIMRDLASGRRVPDLVIQPQLVLKVGAGPTDLMFISPDFVVLDPMAKIYVPGELKSFIVRDIGPSPEDLAPTRLQAAVQTIALRHEAAKVGIGKRVRARAVFVFATPYGLKPTKGEEESLDAEVHMASRAIAKLDATKRDLDRRRGPDFASLPDLVPELRSNFQESCISTCALADICRNRHLGRTPTIGDEAVDLFGPGADLLRLAQLAAGSPPANLWEAEVASPLREAMLALAADDADTHRRIA